MSMTPIQVKGIEYVSTRDLENEYKITRKRCWQELQKLSDIEFITIVKLRFYPVEIVIPHFNSMMRKA